MKLAVTLLLLFTCTLLITCEKYVLDNPWDENADFDPGDWAPQDPTAELISISEIKLTWHYDDYNIEGFKVDRKESDGDWEVAFASLEADARSWNDVEIHPNALFSYRLHAFAGNNTSAYSETIEFSFVAKLNEDFQDYDDFDAIHENEWKTLAEEGNRGWICRTFDGNHYAQATAFNSDDIHNISWMITPPVDLDAIDEPVLNFQSSQAYYTHDGFSLHIATDFDGSNLQNANWESLPATLAGEGDIDHEWVSSGMIDLSDYSGNVHIAWRYEGSHPEGRTGSFRVNNVLIYDTR